jgi:outer membrane receptor protein involved in Fe transport
MAICLAALACGGAAAAQTNSPPESASVTNSTSSTNVTELPEVTVVGKLNEARSQIQPDLGATAYTINKAQIENISQGGNAPFNQLILRAPGVAQDSAVNGDLHVRDEHANLQYRINGVLLPEGITGFGLELDPRFVESMQLITGSLPAQYGFRTSGVVDIQTKSGAFNNGGELEMYGGSHDTLRPSFEIGGSSGNLNYFMDGSYDYNTLGLENPTSTHEAFHDKTYQGKLFAYTSYILDDTSRVSLIASASDSRYQVPNAPGVPVGTAPGGNPWNSTQGPATFDSTILNENQNEQNYYLVATYQKAAGNLNYQASVFGRNSSIHFTPDPVGDLFFNGVASDLYKNLYSGGLQADASYNLGDSHTIRAGILGIEEWVTANSETTVFNLDGAGNPIGQAFPIADNNRLHGQFAGAYLQDEWKIFQQLTLNFGGRLDDFNSSFDNEWQISPRANLIWQPFEATTLHAGYSRYFTPPPVEAVTGTTLNKFVGTSNQAIGTGDSPVRAERSDYYDAGITQKLLPGLQVGLDGYLKNAKQQLDDGLFGQTLILSAFNYDRGKLYGAEFTASYAIGGFSTYANVGYEKGQGHNIDSAQFLFDPAKLAYTQSHWIYLDHDQTVSGSFGAAYTLNEACGGTARFYVDALYGTGLRTDATDSSGNVIPNGGTVPSYYTLNMGAEQAFKLSQKQALKARFDVVNVTDNAYELRNGSGLGVGAPQWGARLGFFGSISYVF